MERSSQNKWCRLQPLGSPFLLKAHHVRHGTHHLYSSLDTQRPSLNLLAEAGTPGPTPYFWLLLAQLKEATIFSTIF